MRYISGKLPASDKTTCYVNGRKVSVPNQAMKAIALSVHNEKRIYRRSYDPRYRSDGPKWYSEPGKDYYPY